MTTLTSEKLRAKIAELYQGIFAGDRRIDFTRIDQSEKTAIYRAAEVSHAEIKSLNASLSLIRAVTHSFEQTIPCTVIEKVVVPFGPRKIVHLNRRADARYNTVFSRIVDICSDKPVDVQTLIRRLVDEAPINPNRKTMDVKYATSYIKTYLKDGKIFLTEK
jgi:hypothetical protein